MVVGKSYKGQVFVPFRTPDDVQAQLTEQALYSKPGAVSLDVWFTVRGHKDPVMQDAMRAFTTVRWALLSDWDELFKGF